MVAAVADRLQVFLDEAHRYPAADRAAAVAEIVSALPDRALRHQAIDSLLAGGAPRNEDARIVLGRLVTFDCLAHIADTDLGHLLPGRHERLTMETWATALKGTPEALQARMAACLPSDTAETLRTTMYAYGPVRSRDVDTAQANIAAALKDLAADGTVSWRTMLDIELV